jgi:hypothetical protein
MRSDVVIPCRVYRGQSPARARRKSSRGVGWAIPWRVPQSTEWSPAGFTVEQVAEAELGRGGEITRGWTQRRARRRLRPRPNSASDEAEICARGLNLASGEAKICARGSVCFTRLIRRPIGGWQVACTYYSGRGGCNHAVASGCDCCLVNHRAPAIAAWVGMHIKCECSPLVFGCSCLICLGSSRVRRTERWWLRARRSSAWGGRLSGRGLGLPRLLPLVGYVFTSPEYVFREG